MRKESQLTAAFTIWRGSLLLPLQAISSLLAARYLFIDTRPLLLVPRSTWAVLLLLVLLAGLGLWVSDSEKETDGTLNILFLRKRIATYYIIETSLPFVRAGTITSRGNFPVILRAVLKKIKRNRAQIINRNVITRMVEKCSRLNPLPVTIDKLYEIAGICSPALRENTPTETADVVVDREARTCVVKACMPHVEAGTILPNISFIYILNDILYIAMCTYRFGPRHIADLVRKFIPLCPVYRPEHRADPLTCGPVSGESRSERLQREVREAIVDACRPHCQAGTFKPKKNFVPILEMIERKVLPEGRVDSQEIAHLVQTGIQKFPARLSEPPAEDMEE